LLVIPAQAEVVVFFRSSFRRKPESSLISLLAFSLSSQEPELPLAEGQWKLWL